MVLDMLKSLRFSVAAAVVAGFAALSPAQAEDAAQLALRVSQMEEQMRMLVGQVEQLTFEVKQLKSQIRTQTGDAASQAPQAPAMQQPIQQKSTTQADTGSGESVIASKAIPDEGVEKIEGQPLMAPAGSGEQQAGQRTAPGPQVLGSMNSAAAPDDGGFQGQVLVAPAQQEAGADAGIIQAPANATAGQEQASVETVALAPDSPESLYERSNESLLRRQFADAEAGFISFMQKYPEHSLAGSAQYWLGETYFAQNQYGEAAKAFLKGYKDYPKSRRAADSLLKLGLSLSRLGQQKQACAAYGAVDSEYPKAVEARKRAQAEAKRAGCQA